MYEIVWMRYLHLIFGSTTVSITMSVALFLLGLGVGGMIFGRIVDRVRYPIFLYGVLELGIGFLGWISPHYFSYLLGVPTEFALQALGASFFVLLGATCMGGTLPVLIRGVVETREVIVRAAGSLYSVNTFGSVAGIAAASFFLIELFGLSTTSAIAACINLGIGAGALCFARRITVAHGPQTHSSLFSVIGYGTPLVLAGISGFISLSLEIVWFRMYQPYLGPATYVFSAILIAFLWGLAAGSAVGSTIAQRHTWLRLGYIYIGIAVSGLGILASLSFLGGLGILLLFLLPIHTFIIGLAFPFFFALKPVKDEHVGSFTGTIYIVNIIGSVLGSAWAGLWLFDAIGAARGAIMILMGSALLGLGLLVRNISLTQFTSIGAGIVIVCVFSFRLPLVPWIKSFEVVYGPAVYVSEDRESHIAAFAHEGSGLLVMNNVGITHLTTDTKLLAHLPLMLHPDPHTMLVIALGAGTTYRSALTHEGLQVTAVDIVPSLPPVIDIFFDDGAAVRANSAGTIVVQDARAFVRRSNETYDVIVADPPPPAWSTAANLFYSKEFYADIGRILSDTGIMVSWLYGGIDQEDALMLEQTFIRSFPYVERWRAPDGAGEYLVGSLAPLPDRESAIIDGMQNAAVASDLNEWVSNPFDGADVLGLFLEDRPALLRRVGDAPILTDNHPRVEFFALRRWF